LRRQFRQGFENRSPVDDSIVSVVEEASAADVDRAVRAAKAALAGPWGAMTIKDRCDLLNAVANRIEKRFDEFLSSLLKNLEIGALAVFLPRVLGRSGCCEQTLTYAVSNLGMRIRL
jgi:acyl-CoA reductase-like NAD-dependent aldehyde dehydrogenase